MRKLGKRNVYILILMIICLSYFVIKDSYAKFTSDYTTSDEVANLSYDFSISVSDVDEYEIVSVNSMDYLIFNIDVTNSLSVTNYYGVWYKIINSTSDTGITVAKLDTSANETSGSVNSNSTKTVTIIIKNITDIDIKLKVGVSNSVTSVNNIKYNDGCKLISLVDSVVYLSSVEAGSYVKYTGNNGCSGNACKGENANYVSSSDMGYCYLSDYKFNVNGFRVGYTDGSNAYLVSAGAPECMSTDSSGNISSSKASSSETTNGVPTHLSNLNKEALLYCNRNYAYGNVCNANTSWALNANDFNYITGTPLSSSSCFDVISEDCGYNNDLIDNGGDYWFATAYDSSSSNKAFNWYPNVSNGRKSGNSVSQNNLGLRPVVKMESSVKVIGGSGTYADPYIIYSENLKNDTIMLNDGAVCSGVYDKSDVASIHNDVMWNKTDKYITLDGNDDWINLGMADQSFSSGATLVARLRVKTVNSGENSILRNSEAAGIGLLFHSDQKFYFQLYDTAWRQVIGSTFDFNTWYTIVGTYDNANMKIYVNGQLIATLANTGTIKTSSAPIVVGVNPGVDAALQGSWGSFDVSDVLIYNTGLSASEVSSQFSGEISNVTDSTNLLSYYKFNNVS